MDKEQARHILRSYRADGSDAGELDFAAALQWAARDQELGEWLCRERAFDRAFSESLVSLPIPADLRENLLRGLQAQRQPMELDAEDDRWVVAMATIEVPASLRARLVHAMAQTAGADPAPAAEVAVLPARKSWRRIGWPVAAAAGIATALFIQVPSFSSFNHALPSGTVARPLSVDFVQASVLRDVVGTPVHYDAQTPSTEEMVRHLRSRQLPCPGELPQGMSELIGMGCREVVINGKRGSLLCFLGDNDLEVHLLVFRRSDVDCQTGCSVSPDFQQNGDWAVARWAEGERVFVMVSRADINDLRPLF